MDALYMYVFIGLLNLNFQVLFPNKFHNLIIGCPQLQKSLIQTRVQLSQLVIDNQRIFHRVIDFIE